MDKKPDLNSASLITLNYNEFRKEIMGDKNIVIIAFVVGWSGSSQILDQILEKLDDGISEKVKILKLDAEKNSALATTFNITTFPSLVFFKRGEIADIMSGLVSQKELLLRLTEHLNTE